MNNKKPFPQSSIRTSSLELKSCDRRILIRGGGVRGLTLAYRLARAGRPVTVFEKEDRVGGLCRSFKEKNIVCDIGPHLFWNQHVQTLSLMREIGAADTLFNPHLIHGLYLRGHFFAYHRLSDMVRLAPRGFQILGPVLKKRFSGQKASGLQVFQLLKTFLFRGKDIYSHGGIQVFPESLARAIRAQGGEVLLNRMDTSPEAVDCTPQGPHLHLMICIFGLNQQLSPGWFDTIFPEERYWFQRIVNPALLNDAETNGGIIAADRYVTDPSADPAVALEDCRRSLNEVFPGFDRMVTWERSELFLNAFPVEPGKGLLFAGMERAVLEGDMKARNILEGKD